MTSIFNQNSNCAIVYNMSETTNYFSKKDVYHFHLKLKKLLSVFMFKLQFEVAWTCNNREQYRFNYFEGLQNLYYESLRDITNDNLMLVCYGAAIWMTNEKLCKFWAHHFKKNPIILSIFTYLLSEENWIYLQQAIPNHLTVDNAMFKSKKKCLDNFLLHVPPAGNLYKRTKIKKKTDTFPERNVKNFA